ncbi:integrase core domain protein [Plakobranchus ocellatus]|uniref:Integrase core domain protein n=1 Tax=Plakobranchus ocellatus TaxID=259542 RepID=A0AAV4B8S4_9GAST|nr:integrase core domain protein [Plakobranchus ocellatus]
MNRVSETKQLFDDLSNLFVRKQCMDACLEDLLFDGSVTDFLIARHHAETPFITGVLEASVVGDPIACLIVVNCGHISDSPLKEWLSDSNSDNDRKERHRHANAVSRAYSKADTAYVSDQNKDKPKTELNCLDYNVFRKGVGIQRSPYSALFGNEARVGLTTSTLPREILDNLESEEDLARLELPQSASIGDADNSTADAILTAADFTGITLALIMRPP